MNSIAIPETLEHQAQTVEGAAVCLIAAAVAVAPGSLQAQFQEGEESVAWYLITGDQQEKLCAMDQAHFKDVLTWIGYHYMDEQPEGGAATPLLTQGDTSYFSLFELGNSPATGYWAKISARPMNPI
jgi:hypothetical protein